MTDGEAINRPAAKGQRASKQGRVLERTIIPAFETRGFLNVSYTEWSRAPEKYGNELILSHVPYTTIYGHKGFTEFLVRSEKFKLNHRIECKWQRDRDPVI